MKLKNSFDEYEFGYNLLKNTKYTRRRDARINKADYPSIKKKFYQASAFNDYWYFIDSLIGIYQDEDENS